MSSTTSLPVKYGEAVGDLTCLDPTHANKGAQSVTCVGDNMFIVQADIDKPSCLKGLGSLD